MSKSVRIEIVSYFMARMAEHSKVLACKPIADDEEELFLIHRPDRLPDVRVHLSDAYAYTEAEYIGRPDFLGRNSFVVLLPHAGAPDWVVEQAQADGIGIGKIRKFMGALNYRDVWKYIAPEDRRH